MASITSVITPVSGTNFDRPLVLFLAGLSGNFAQWDLVVQSLPAVDADLAYGAPILPSPALGERRPTVTGVASAICSELRRDGRKDVFVVAHSVGSFVALGMARLAPEMVRSVILINGGLTTVAKFLDHPVREMLVEPRTCLNALRLFLLVGAPTPRSVKDAISHSERTSRLFLGGLVSDAALDTQERRDSLMAEAGRPDTLRALWDNRHHWQEFEGYAGQITTKVLFIVGDEDPLGTVKDTQAMAALLPNAEVQVLKGVGHAAPLETATAVAEAIVKPSASERPG